jgi:hypothetical protein
VKFIVRFKENIVSTLTQFVIMRQYIVGPWLIGVIILAHVLMSIFQWCMDENFPLLPNTTIIQLELFYYCLIDVFIKVHRRCP